MSRRSTREISALAKRLHMDFAHNPGHHGLPWVVNDEGAHAIVPVLAEESLAGLWERVERTRGACTVYVGLPDGGVFCFAVTPEPPAAAVLAATSHTWLARDARVAHLLPLLQQLATAETVVRRDATGQPLAYLGRAQRYFEPNNA